MKPYLIITIGGIASGKSQVARLFNDFGARTVSADPIAHELLGREDVQKQIRAEFGDGVFDAKGAVDRKALGTIVFADRKALKFLEAILHPLVKAELQGQVRDIGDEFARHWRSKRPVVLLDIPLAAEAGWLDEADIVVYVDCDEQTRIKRAIANRGWTAEELRLREANQMPLSEKQALSDYSVNNSHTVAKARQDVERIWKQFIEPRLTAL